ncbi:hypothetical protein RVBP21_0270 [Pseudomonas phage BRkr]|nr:hypothetical protein RVBP21_0270 [Pseudomonas phage BRkr]
MSTVSTTGLYDEDLHGTNPANLITGEIQTLQVPGPTDYYFIIPKAAPFFVDSLKVRNNQTGALFVEGVDYMIGHRFIEAMDSIGRPIAGSIRFMKRSIAGQARLDYRTIGGQWGFSDQAILAELSRRQYNPLIRAWGNIDVLPASFPPLDHDQPIDSLVGSEEINASLQRLGDIMEATASGTTESHLRDYDNPHRVNKVQIQLGNVPNFSMATDQQHKDGNRNDMFTNPRGVLLSIQENALKPLNAHIAATGNVHGMVPRDIGLGNVPNYPAATPQQAVDPTNNSTLMTPYTVSLLIQAVQGDPRLDQLIIDFNKHLTDTNPHNITPGLIGTYTKQEIDQKIAAGGSGGDATTFGGETPEEWEAKFPLNSDINGIMAEVTEKIGEGIASSADISFNDPTPPDEQDKERLSKIQGVLAGAAAYALFNGSGDTVYRSEPAGADAYPITSIRGAAWSWLSLQDADYHLVPAIRDFQSGTWSQGDGIRSAGSAKLAIPAGWAAGAGFNQANAMVAMWGSKTALYVQLKPSDGADEGKIMKIAGGTVTQLYAESDNVTEMWVATEEADSRQMAIVEKSPPSGDPTYTAIGASDWVSAATPVIAAQLTGGWEISDIRIGSKYLVFQGGNTTNGNASRIRVYEITYTPTFKLTEVTSTLDVWSAKDNRLVKANTLTDVSSISGNYGHHAVQIRRDPSSLENMDTDIAMFGSNENGQLEIPYGSAPFYSAAAGKGFTVTVNNLGYTEFWGDSPTNALIWNDGTTIVAP